MSPIWSNWPGEQVCAPSAIVRPTSEAELADVIAQAAKRGERVRAVGSGHSFTDIACTDGVMIDMTGLQRVLDVDQPTGLVTVEGAQSYVRWDPNWRNDGSAWRTRVTWIPNPSPARPRPRRTEPGCVSRICRRGSFRCGWSPRAGKCSVCPKVTITWRHGFPRRARSDLTGHPADGSAIHVASP